MALVSEFATRPPTSTTNFRHKLSISSLSNSLLLPPCCKSVTFRLNTLPVYRAKEMLKRVTIDGRPVTVRTKRWNGSVIRRLWHRTVG